MAKKKESYFWTSYSDLMTSLFFIMLTLFILTVVLLNQRMRATQDELDKIKTIQNSTKELERKDGYFEYNEEYEKFALKIDVFFPVGQTSFDYLTDECKNELSEAGKQVVDFLNNHKENKYLLIIEGQASQNSQNYMHQNYQLSFDRAKNLMIFWLPKFKKYWDDEKDPQYLPNKVENCEIQIAGSGDGRLNINSMRNKFEEEKNQRFLIYIIPKNIMRDDEKN